MIEKPMLEACDKETITGLSKVIGITFMIIVIEDNMSIMK
jgi:hypothetical protein